MTDEEHHEGQGQEDAGPREDGAGEDVTGLGNETSEEHTAESSREATEAVDGGHDVHGHSADNVTAASKRTLNVDPYVPDTSDSLPPLPPNTHAPDSPTTHLINSLRDQLTLVSDQAHELNTKLVSAIHSRADAEDALAHLQQAHSSLRSQADTLSSDLGAATTARSTLNTELAGLKDKHGALTAEHAELQTRAEGLELEKQRWEESMNTGLLVERSQISAEMQKLAQGLVDEERRRGSAEEKRQQVESEVDDLAASLFDQANQMVATEKMARASAESRLKSTEENLAAAEAAMRDMQLHLQSLSSASSTSSPSRRVSRKPSLGFESRFLSSHLPYTEYLGFLSHLRSLRPLKETSKAIFPPPMVVSLLAQPFLTRTVAEEHDPTLRLDIAPDLGWMTRKGVSQAIMAGDLVVEPLPADVLIANASADPHEMSCSLCGKPIFPALAGFATPASPGAYAPPPLHPTQRSVSSSRFSLKPYFKSSNSSPGPAGGAVSPSISPLASPNPALPANLASLGSVYVFRVAKQDGTASAETQIKLYPLCKTGWCLERLRATCELWHFVRTGIIHPVWHGDDGFVLPTERDRVGADGTPRTARQGSAETGSASTLAGGGSSSALALTPTLSSQSGASSATATRAGTLSPTPETAQPKQRKSGWGLGFGLNTQKSVPGSAAPSASAGAAGGWRSGWGRSGSGTGTVSSSASNGVNTPPASPGPTSAGLGTGTGGHEYTALSDVGDSAAPASRSGLNLGPLDKAPVIEGNGETQPSGSVTPQDERDAKKLIEEMNRAIPKDEPVESAAEKGDKVEELVEERIEPERQDEPNEEDTKVVEQEKETSLAEGDESEDATLDAEEAESTSVKEPDMTPVEEDDDDDDQLERLLAAAAAEDGAPIPVRQPKPEISISQSTPDQGSASRVPDTDSPNDSAVGQQEAAVDVKADTDQGPEEDKKEGEEEDQEDENEAESTEGFATPTEEQREPSLSLSEPAEIVEPAPVSSTAGLKASKPTPLILDTQESNVVDLSSPGRPPRAASRTPVSATASGRASPSPSPVVPNAEDGTTAVVRSIPTAPPLPARRSVDLTPRSTSVAGHPPPPPPRHPQSHTPGQASPRAPPLPSRHSAELGPRTPSLQRSSLSGSTQGQGQGLTHIREGEVKGEEDRRYLVQPGGGGSGTGQEGQSEQIEEGWEAKTWRAVVRLKEDMWRARVGVELVSAAESEEDTGEEQ